MQTQVWLIVLEYGVMPLLVNELASDFCQAVLTLGTGNQTRVMPLALGMSTRVVTSKVRQSPGWGANVRFVGAVVCWAFCADAVVQGAKERAPKDAAP